VYINGDRFNYRVDSVLAVDAEFYCGDGETVTVYAVDFAGNKSNEVTLANPYYIKEEPPKEPTPFTPDGQATVVDTATEGDGKTFYTFTTPEDNVFYLVIDHERDTDNVYFLNAVTESDLLALAAEPSEAETAIPAPAPTPPPAEDTPDEEEEPAEPEQPEKKGNGSLIFILLGIAAAGGAGYYFKIVKPKQQGQAYDDDDYGEEAEDDGKEMEFEDEQEEETEDEPQTDTTENKRSDEDE
jgi:hypothetical protein